MTATPTSPANPGRFRSGPPRVTIVVSCYNHATWVEECLRSIEAQTFPDYEVIAVDDASQDQSAAAMARWLDDHATFPFSVQVHGTNLGVCASINRATANGSSDADYVAVVAGDDVMCPDRLERQVAALDQAGDGVGFCYSDVEPIDVDGCRLDLHPDGTTAGDTPRDFPTGDIYADLLDRCFVPAPSVLIRRSALEVMGGFDESLAFEDWDMWLRISERHLVHYAPMFAAKKRVVPGSLFGELSSCRKADFCDSRGRLLAKHLGSNPTRDAKLADRIRTDGYELWKLNDKRASHLLGLACRVDRRPRTTAWWLLATARVPRSWLARPTSGDRESRALTPNR